MKNIFLLSLLLFPAFHYGQSVKKKIADKDYQSFHYAEAIKYYESILAKNPDDTDSEAKLADCYRQINDTKNAEKWYAKVAKRANSNPIAKLYYAEALAGEQQYEAAKDWYAAYAEAQPNDTRGQNFVKFYDTEKANLEANANDYKVELAKFNAEMASDFSPAFMGDKIVFCSNRHSSSNGIRKDEFKWTKTSFLDLYIADTSGKVEIFSKQLNSRYHEGPVVFYENNSKIVFTRNNYHEGKYKESSEGINKLKMFFAEKMPDGSWGNIVPFAYNSDEYSVGHPTFSPDGKRIYFASDMPGGIGETDLYVSEWQNGTWSKPINLGNTINTEGKEEFPFMDNKGNLFFSSTGFGGFGGLDIFFAENLESQLQKPVNVGVPLNSSQDDFGIIVDTTGKAGYLSSDRANASAQDDIYKFVGKPFGSFISLRAITINAETKQALPQTSLTITLGEEVPKTILLQTNENGMAERKFNKNFSYTFAATKEGFEPTNITFSAEQIKSFKDGDVMEIPLKPVVEDMPLVKILDEETREPVASHLIVADKSNKIFLEKKEIEKEILKDIPNGKYNLRVTAKGYFFKNDTMTIVDNKKKTEKIVLLRKLKKNAILTVNNITFEFNSDKLTPLSKKEVAYVAQLMQENPSLKIGVYAHTDAVGTDAKNMILSEKRAKSVYTFINSQGIPMDRMVWKGFGESKPITTNNTKEGRAQNRRVEFEVLEVEGVQIEDKFNKDKQLKEDKFDEKKAAEEEKKKP